MAKLESDGLIIMKGTMRILDIIVEGNNIEYEVALFGELGGFINKVGNARLEDLDFSDYNHVYSKDAIVNSWNYESKTYIGWYLQFLSSNNKIFFPFQVISFISIGDVLTFTGTSYNNTSYTITAKIGRAHV